MTAPIRLRAPSGQLRLDVDENSSLGQLVSLIREKTGLQNFTLKYSYPLKNLDITPEALGATVADLGLRGETIVVAPADSRPADPEPPKPSPKPFVPKGVEPDETVVEWPERGGYMALRVMPDDNSCMFTAFGGAVSIPNPSQFLREQIAEYIMQHPDQYNKAILGDEPERYVSRILQKDTWGGAIELSVLSDIYNIEISSIDVKSLRVDKFGENKETRCIILYSGIHYDRIAYTMELTHPVEYDVTIWSTSEDEALQKAVDLAQKLQRVHYFTDTTDFVIKCEVLDCNWIGQGTKQAAQHEKETGHSRFGELQLD